MKNRNHRLIFYLVIFTGVFLRFLGSGFGIETSINFVRKWHPDEVAWIIQSMGEGLRTGYLYYGTAHIYLLWAINKIVYLILSATGINNLSYLQFLENTEALRYLFSRWISASFSIMTLFLIYRIGRRIFDSTTGTIAFLFMALNPVDILHSHYATVDEAFTFYITASLFLLLRFRQTGSIKHLIGSAITTGLAVGTKYTGIFLLLPWSLIFLSSLHNRSETSQNSKGKQVALFLLPLFTGLTVFLLTNPFILYDFNLFKTQVGINIALDGAFMISLSTLKAYFIYLWLFITRFGALFVPATFAGAFILVKRNKTDALLILSFPIIYFLIIGGMTKQSTPRHMLPLLPVAMVLSGIFLSRVVEVLGKKLNRNTAVTGTLLLFLLQPIISTFNNTKMLVLPDTRLAAEKWCATHIPAGSKVLIDRNGEYSPYLNPNNYRLGTHDLRIDRINGIDLPDSAATLKEAIESGYRFAVISELLFSANSDVVDFHGYYEDLRNDPRTKLIAVFRKNHSINLSFHNPCIEIYKLSESPFKTQTDQDLFYEHTDGNSYVFQAKNSPCTSSPADSENNHEISTLVLTENGFPLGPAHCLHEEIARLGMGRYSHWNMKRKGRVVLFSSSDNTDPNKNGRLYECMLEPLRPGEDRDHHYLHLDGFKYELHPADNLVSDDEKHPLRSRVILFENDHPLGPAHADHEDIAQCGKGKYSFWNGKMLFSTSDNSNPNRNGRLYRIIEVPSRPQLDSDLFFRETDHGTFLFEPDPVFFGPGKASLLGIRENGKPLSLAEENTSHLQPGEWRFLGDGIDFLPTDGSNPNMNGKDYRAILDSPAHPPKKMADGKAGDLWMLKIWEGYREDTITEPRLSNVILTINGYYAGPAHTDPRKAECKTNCYIHENGEIIFSFNPEEGETIPENIEYYEAPLDPFMDPDRFFVFSNRYNGYLFEISGRLLPFLTQKDIPIVAEDGNPLPLQNSESDSSSSSIAAAGYSQRLDRQTILFMPVDGSDPNRNGRRYSIVLKRGCIETDISNTQTMK